MAYQQINIKPFCKALNIVKINVFPDFWFRDIHSFQNSGYCFFQLAALAAGGTQHRMNPYFSEQGGDADDEIFFTIDYSAFAEDVFMAVYHGVNQSPPGR